MNKRTIPSPIGRLEIHEDNDHIVAIQFHSETDRNDPSDLLDECEKQLSEYFKGERSEFSLPLELRGTDFQKQVWTELQNIPYGKTISYSELAIRLGDIKTIRAAGSANGKNNLPIVIPCHRVIGKNGALVGFAGGLDTKKWLLKHEGIIRGEQMGLFTEG